MNYLAYHFTVNPPQPGSEILTAMLSDFAFDSFDTHENGFVAYIKEEDAAEVKLDDLIFEDFTYTCKVEKIPQSNWNEEWEKNFEPVLVENLLCIRAPFHPKNELVKHEIVIMPKMSFGTGHHQTTRLVCSQMFELEFKNKRVLDMGCGTGILAILASMLGATNVTGIDIDEWSVENAKENCSSNGYPEMVIKKGGVELLNNKSNYEVILANINKNILKAQLPVYSQCCSSGAILILSGFFITDAEEMKKEAEASHFNFIKAVSENEWTAMVFRRD